MIHNRGAPVRRVGSAAATLLNDLLNDFVAFRLRWISQRAACLHWASIQEARAVSGEIKCLKLAAAETVNQRIQQAVDVGEDHEAVEDHGCVLLDDLIEHLEPNDQQDHPGDGAGQEAEGEDHHDNGHQENGSPQFGPDPDGFPPEPDDDAHRAVRQDDERDEDLAEENHFSHALHRVLK